MGEELTEEQEVYRAVLGEGLPVKQGSTDNQQISAVAPKKGSLILIYYNNTGKDSLWSDPGMTTLQGAANERSLQSPRLDNT